MGSPRRDVFHQVGVFIDQAGSAGDSATVTCKGMNTDFDDGSVQSSQRRS